MTTSLLKGKRFYCREWAFSKVNHCLDNRPTAKTCGALIMGGPGCGKTALCCEIVWPSSTHGKQVTLSKKVLAYYFCQAHDIETLSITTFVHCIVEQLSKSSMVPGYEEHLQNTDIQCLLDPVQCEKNPDLAFRKGVLEPLSMIPPPPSNLFLLVDSIDESYFKSINEKASGSRTIAELLSNNHQHFPQWLLLMCSARKQSKSVTRMFTGFRKISLDDLRKSHVVRDVQQYILCRLDQEEELRQHLSRETAEMLNQLHIKSNGCFLYLDKVLDGVAETFILLREIREIPGTLNGLYLWLCQRLFARKLFTKVLPILNVILAARRPLTEMELYSCAYTRNTSLTFDEFKKRLDLLSKILIEGKDGTKILFHHSFAEWLLDVKHCTQKYLCAAADGHGMLAMSFTMHAPSLTSLEIQDFALHLAKSNLHETMDSNHLALWMLQSGAAVEDSLSAGMPKETSVLKLLIKAGAKPVTPDEPLVASAETAAPNVAEPSGEPVVAEASQTMESLEEVDSNGRTMLCSAAYQGNLSLVSQLLAKHVDLEAVDKSGQTALNLAARQGHSEIVGVLVKEGAIVDHEDHDGWTALRSAAWGGHTEVVELLLDAGAEVDHADSDQRTALRAAAWGGHEKIVLRLLEHEAEVNKVDNEGRTALIAAAYMGHCDIVQHLLDHGADINHQDIDGRTALSVAALCIPASHGHTEVVSLLLEQEAEVDHQDKDGMTPLLVAAYEGHQNVCDLLLESDADVDHSDVNGRTPLQAAASMGHGPVINQLLFWAAAVDAIDSDGRTVLCIAAQQGSFDVVRQLLNRGLDEMHRDNAGWTPLHMAAFEGHKEVVDLLVESGARITEIDNDGRIPMLLAAQEGHQDIVAALLDYGSPIEARAHDGKTSLRVSALEGHKEVVKFLIQSNADVNYKDADGRSTLYVLSLENHVPMAAFLLDNIADVEGCDLEGRTPLHVAAWQGHFEMADMLLSHAADVNAVDNDRRTALQSAAWQGHANIVKLLLEKGAVVDHTCNQGATALCIAAQEGHEEVVQVLLQFHANPNHADQFGRTATRVALKGSHNKVVKLLEDFGALPLNGVNGRRSGGAGTASSGVNTNTKPIPNPAPHAHKRSVTNGDRRHVAPIRNPSQALASAMAIANGHIHGNHGKKSPSESPGSTFDTRKSLSNQSNKSSSNHTNSVHTNSTNQSSCSGGQADTVDPGNLTFTQQLQQCSMSKNRNRPLSKVLSPVGEPHSPCQDSPGGSPLSEIQGNCRLSPDMQSPGGVISPRRIDGRGDPIRIISNPTDCSTNNIYESIDEPIWQRQVDCTGRSAVHAAGHTASLKTAKPDVHRKGSQKDVPTHVSPLVMGSAALSMKSPEMRRKRNGIVTNPNFSMTKNVSINGYFNKLADTVDNYPEGRTPNGNTPSASLPSKRPTRPSGLPLKKETPL